MLTGAQRIEPMGFVARYSFDVATVEALTQQLLKLQEGVSPADVVILGGAGKDFSLGRQPAAHGPPAPEDLIAVFSRLQRLTEVVQRYPGVIIAKMQGLQRGAVLSLAGRCDLIYAGEDARLSSPNSATGSRRRSC